jgi:hypothetical protein
MKDVARQRNASGSCEASYDPEMSEWGNPYDREVINPTLSKVGVERRTQGTETSKYLQEKKSQRFRQ